MREKNLPNIKVKAEMNMTDKKERERQGGTWIQVKSE